MSDFSCWQFKCLRNAKVSAAIRGCKILVGIVYVKLHTRMSSKNSFSCFLLRYAEITTNTPRSFFVLDPAELFSVVYTCMYVVYSFLFLLQVA